MPAKGVQRAHLCRSDGGVFISEPVSTDPAADALPPAGGAPDAALDPEPPAQAPAPAPARGANAAATAFAVVVADGDVPDRAVLDAAWPGWLARDALVIAADGGWFKALALGLRPSVLVGDADSLPMDAFRDAAAAGVETRHVAAMKDESDTELAVVAALGRGARHLTILGALGGRLDHTFANVGLLALPDPEQATIELLDGRTRVRLLRAPLPDGVATCSLAGPVGDLVSLLPLAARAEGVTTDGLLYPLDGEPLPMGPARGLSNVRTNTNARVSLRAGWLLVIETRPDNEPPSREGDRP